MLFYLKNAESVLLVTVNNISDPTGTSYPANDSLITNNVGFLQLNVTLDKGTFTNYSCNVESNYTDNFMGNPDSGTISPCYTEGANKFCFVSPPLILNNGTSGTIGFSIPNGNWLYRVKCNPIKTIYIKVNASVSSETPKFSFNMSSVNLSEGDVLVVRNNATANSSIMGVRNGTDAEGINLTIKVNASSFFSGYGEKILSIKNVSNGSLVSFFTSPDFTNSRFFPDIPSFYTNKNLIALNQSNISQVLASIVINSGVITENNASGVVTLGGNVSDIFLIKINGSIKPPIFFNDSITNASLCPVGDKFCMDLGSFGGGSANSTFFFSSFEDCHDGIDNDGDSAIDVSDSDCSYLPNFNINQVSDSNAPKILQIKTFGFGNMMYLQVINDEPSNTSLEFYYLDSNCGQNGLNNTFFAQKMNNITNSEFKPFHMFNLDSATLRYSLTQGSTYYYKIQVQDLKGNSAEDTKCRSFTTSSTNFDNSLLYNFSFYTPPKTGEFTNIDYNLSINGTIMSIDNLINGGVNATTNATLIINDTAKNWTIELSGIKLLGNYSINLSGALKSTTSANTRFIGMNHTAWLEISQLLGAETVSITLPDISNTLQKCDDQVSNCQDITSKATKISQTGSSTRWAVSLSTGFSSYGGATSSGGAGSGGTSGGGGGLSVFYVTSEGTEIIVHEGNSINFVLGSESHKLKILNVKSNDLVEMVIFSYPINLEIAKEKTKNVDLNRDSINDLSVSVIDITNKNVKLLIKQIKPEIIGPTGAIIKKETSEKVTEERSDILKPEPPAKVKDNKDIISKVLEVSLISLILVGISLFFYLRKRKGKITFNNL